MPDATPREIEAAHLRVELVEIPARAFDTLNRRLELSPQT